MKKLFLTEVHAIDPQDRKLKVFAGPEIVADSIEDAQEWCNENDLPYVRVVGEYVKQFEINYN